VSGNAVVAAGDLVELFTVLRSDGFDVIGPTVRDGAIVYDAIDGPDALPRGWTDVQEAGKYRLERRADDALFGYAVGPTSWKRWFQEPRVRLFRAARTGTTTFAIEDEGSTPRRPVAVIGARACELAAVAIQDRVLLGSGSVDTHYAERRRDAFFVALQCGRAGGTCFCASMGTGPEATTGFDLALTELLEPVHRFLVTVGSPRGASVLSRMRSAPASSVDEEAARDVLATTRASMGRRLDVKDIRDVLMTNLEHPRWDDVAQRCLGCANCTLVCPTCFCTTVEDVNDLRGEHAERWRRWDSCFTADHSHVHGGSVRSGIRSRYRQWMTHKLATWIDQFGQSGCVGCGRCITWCPVGIDITEETAAIRKTGEGT
jgi:ferredoxin